MKKQFEALLNKVKDILNNNKISILITVGSLTTLLIGVFILLNLPDPKITYLLDGSGFEVDGENHTFYQGRYFLSVETNGRYVEYENIKNEEGEEIVKILIKIQYLENNNPKLEPSKNFILLGDNDEIFPFEKNVSTKSFSVKEFERYVIELYYRIPREIDEARLVVNLDNDEPKAFVNINLSILNDK